MTLNGAPLRVLVTDGDQRAALAIVRSLGRAGHRVFVCGQRRRSIASMSKHSSGAAAIPDSLCNPERFVAGLRGLIDRWRIDMLLPVSEASLLAILDRSDALGDVMLPFPRLREFERVCDKSIVAEVAASVGIDVPKQVIVASPMEPLGYTTAGLRFPVAVKPTRSVAGTGTQRLKTSVVYANDPDVLESILAALPRHVYPVLVQERVIGPGVGVFLLLWDSEVRASFCHRRLREKPPSGGVSVSRESIPPDAGLIAASTTLLRRLNWKGVAMVEFKLDRSGTPFLLEINGRFWGSLQLAIDAGVDFPALLVAAAQGLPVPPVASYRIGVRSRWFWGDTDHVLARLRHSRQELGLPPGAPSTFKAIGHYLAAFGPGERSEVLRLDDPAPAVWETLEWLRGR